MEFLEQPTALGHGMGDGLVLHLFAGAGDGGLAFGGPRHQIVAEVDALA
jgi:hypothetical protein